MKGVLKPEVYEDIREVWRVEKDKKLPIDEEDSHLSALSESRGWAILKEHIENLKVGLDKRLSESVLKSLGDSQIKTDALFSVLGKELLNSIITKVEDSAEEVERITNEREQQEKNKRGNRGENR